MKTALQFSGGKDSLALLMHMKAFWPFMDVLHVNTGDSPEPVEEIIEWASKTLPRFTVIYSDSREFRRTHANPNGESWFNCCAANIYLPMAALVKHNGYRQILHGTKRCDPHIHGAFPGDIHDGVIYTFPLWDWSDRDVETIWASRCRPRTAKGRSVCRTASHVPPQSPAGATRGTFGGQRDPPIPNFISGVTPCL